MPMHLPSGLYMQSALASYSFGREALCGIYHWRSVLRNIIIQADKVHRSDPNFIVWIGWLHIKANL